ncbi:MAG TPA: hypothetical protein VJ909_07910 [Prolixibacteraceae bacterium]|nr:hypothetical protein [Prolixibacteraceae bacterium]
MNTKILKSNHLKRIIIILLTITPFTLLAQKEVTWDYPIKPGTEEWKSLKSYDEKLNAYNFPIEVLEKMNTKNLVKTCLAYPEFRLIMTRNSIQEGYSYIKSIFNGFAELEKRKDSGFQLIDEYRKLKPVEVKNYNELVDQGKHIFKFTYLEILLAQRAILTNMSVNDKKELLELGISNYEGKYNLPKYYSSFGLETSTLVLGRLLDVDNYQAYISAAANDERLKRFIASSILFDSSSLAKTIDLAKNYEIRLKNE